MLTEIDIFGVCVSPFAPHLLAAAPPFLACRWLLARTGLLAWTWHPALVELSLFILTLAVVAYV